jgi:DNA repair exonuclease SbcCD nuclease subunit
MTNVICIGDPHFQVNNIPEVELFMDKLDKLILETKPDFCVVLGDLLHTHERLHTVPLNKAYEFIDRLRQKAKTYVLVGNHDMTNNGQYLNENHWLNGMKEWENTIIVDKVVRYKIDEKNFVFVPYVPPGRFIEALDTIGDVWKQADCIFAHQEFAGCKMGAIVSVEGDKWPLDYPQVVSGHIHSRQIPQPNIYYTGSAMQHAFGESEKNIIAHLCFNDISYERNEIDLGLPRKKIVYMDVEHMDDYEVPQESVDKIKITLSGSYDQFKALKKTKKYKKMLEKGLKVVFKPKKLKRTKKETGQDGKETDVIDEVTTNNTEFSTILQTIVNNEKDPYLFQAYELVVNGKKMNTEDVFFL